MAFDRFVVLGVVLSLYFGPTVGLAHDGGVDPSDSGSGMIFYRSGAGELSLTFDDNAFQIVINNHHRSLTIGCSGTALVTFQDGTVVPKVIASEWLPPGPQMDIIVTAEAARRSYSWGEWTPAPEHRPAILSVTMSAFSCVTNR